MEKSRYQPHIDGLRGIAVLSVLFFHAGYATFTGGFVGVDIFFVISGFLITNNIYTNHRQGGFCFKDFYIRRARRLLPALCFTLIISFILGILLFTPEHLERLAEALMFSVISLSNFFFLQESGYFDTAKDFKPLLHMWSLSVEEQFYLFWPTVLTLLLFTKRTVIIVSFLIITTLVSTYYAHQWIINNQASAAFYLTPFRMGEFCIGALVVWLDKHRTNKIWPNELLVLIGLGLITFSIVSFNNETPFPGLYALVPCIGSALVIYAGKNSIFLGRLLLSNKPLIGIGLISYSLYLIHWPLFVFYKYWKFNPITPSEQLILVLLSFILAYWMYRMIEVPFRCKTVAKHISVKVGFSAIVISLTITIFSAAHAAYNGGWKQRISPKFTAFLKDQRAFHIEHYGGNGFELSGYIGANPDNFDILLMGDSFAHQYSTGLDKVLKKNNLTAQLVFQHGCPFGPGITRLLQGKPYRECSEKMAIVNDLLAGNNKPLLLGQHWKGYFELISDHTGKKIQFVDRAEYHDFLLKNLKNIRNLIGTSRALIIVGTQPGSGNDSGIISCVNRPTYLPSGCISDLGFEREKEAVNKALKSYADSQENTYYLNPFDALCNNNWCHPVDVNGGKIWYSDGAHLSKEGSIKAAQYYETQLLKIINNS